MSELADSNKLNEDEIITYPKNQIFVFATIDPKEYR